MVDIEQSMLASIGRFIAPIFTPLGWDNWRASVASITGLVAKESVVGTFGVLYGFSSVADNGAEVWGRLQSSFTMLSAYSFLIFNLLCAPCFAAIGAVRTEMNSGKWTLFSVGYQTGFAYIIALIVYEIGSLFTGKTFGVGSAVAIAFILLLLYMIFRKPSKVDVEVTDPDMRRKEVV